MTHIHKQAPVLVTGATGYVAGWLVKRLLDEGLTVHAAVRDPENKAKVAHLEALAHASRGVLKFFKSDLLKEGSYAEGMQACELVFHTASPFINVVKDPQKELIDPALKGTRNILEEASRTESVKRVVLTSSMAAIYGSNSDLKKVPGGVLTEDIWNSSSSLKKGAYSYSKTLAEREAWKIAGAQERWDLVVINPSLVLGPSVNPAASVTSESFRILKQFGNGSMKAGVADLSMGMVDVRDVAEAHYQAAFRPEAEGRHITSGHNGSFPEMGQIIREKYGKTYPISEKVMPKALLWLVGPMVSKSLTRDFISNNIGLPFRADNSKSREKLGITYRPLKETVLENWQQMIDEKQW